jgi:hypothetical protein
VVDPLRGERVVLARVVDHHGLLQRIDDLVLDDLPGGVDVAASDVDAADGDPRCDLILLGLVVGPDGDREQQEHRHRRGGEDQNLVMHFQLCAHGFNLDQLSWRSDFTFPRRRPPRRCLFARRFAPAYPLQSDLMPRSLRIMPMWRKLRRA